MNTIPVSHGMLFMASIITALGPQNLHVLRCAAWSRNALGVVLICSLGDSFLILAGTLSISYVVNSLPQFDVILKVTGVTVLSFYAISAIQRCFTREHDDAVVQVGPAIKGALLYTFLNPLVYLDSFFLVGQQANTYPGTGRWYFAIGALGYACGWYTMLAGLSKLIVTLVDSSRIEYCFDVFAAFALSLAVIYCLL